jgi:alcohol dehydrogenase (cytochrome c)
VTSALLFLALAAAQSSAPPGRSEFTARCASCHGGDANGGERAPAIRRDRTDAQLIDLIRRGKPATGMPAFNLPAADMQRLIAFIRATPPLAEPSSHLQNVRAIPFSELAAPHAGDWPSYHGRLDGNRHSPLAQISAANVSKLAPRWMFTFSGSGNLQNTPVVVDGVMYATAVNEVHALDARNGRSLWRFQRPRSQGLSGDAAGGINRGVALLGTRVFLVTDNAHLLALDRANGKLEWEVEMADSRQNYGATSAPLAVHDLIVSGTSGGDEGARGFLAAYRADTGERVWRLWTIPAAGEPLAKTWVGSALEHGCTTAWLTGTYDPKLDLLYWTTGNPCPDYNGDERKGDNLYSDSVLALKPATGELQWHYQFTPHDLHDWDAQQTPMLIDAPFGGTQRHLLVQANRNGFFYVLDRTDGRLLLGKPFVDKLTWASGIGADGRPQLLPGAEPTVEGVRACPAVEGATNWFSTAFHPDTGLFYVMSLEKCNIYTKAPAVWQAGKSYYGGTTKRVPGEVPKKYLRALDPQTGRRVWELPQDGPGGSWGGVLSTAGGVVFYGGDGGDFAAADARTGRPLWHWPANAFWKASPMTFLASGRQYVAIAAGPNILAFALPEE